MADKYPVSSYNDEAIAAFDVDSRQLLQNGVTAGRVFWLRELTVTKTGAADEISLYDSNTEGASPTVTLERWRGFVPATSTTQFKWDAPGLKFLTGILAGEVAAVGGIAAYAISVSGYEE